MTYSIIIGTNRENSNSGLVGEYYKHKFQQKGILVNLIYLKDIPHDYLFSNMFGKKNTAFTHIQELITKTDKFIFIIPEYNGSFPGVLKAFIDGCDFPKSFAGKKCSLVGLSSGRFGNLRGLEHFTGVAHYVKMDVLYNKIYLAGVNDQYVRQELPKNTFLNQLIDQQIEEFITF
jgi:chromate reductase, NAD(P)H dehydrogenase (quinone)